MRFFQSCCSSKPDPDTSHLTFLGMKVLSAIQTQLQTKLKKFCADLSASGLLRGTPGNAKLETANLAHAVYDYSVEFLNASGYFVEHHPERSFLTSCFYQCCYPDKFPIESEQHTYDFDKQQQQLLEVLGPIKNSYPLQLIGDRVLQDLQTLLPNAFRDYSRQLMAVLKTCQSELSSTERSRLIPRS